MVNPPTSSPIVLSEAEILAIMAGKKFQFRVAIPDVGDHQTVVRVEDPSNDGKPFWRFAYSDGEACQCVELDCPHGVEGDRLWVQEPFWEDWREPGVVIYDASPEWGKYRDQESPIRSTCPDGHMPTREESRAAMLPKFWSKKSASEMSRWASRFEIEIVEIRAERLRSISSGDAMAEGVGASEFWRPKELEGRPFEEKWWDDCEFWERYPRLVFPRHWDSIHGEGSWDRNPWVWAIGFNVIQTEM